MTSQSVARLAAGAFVAVGVCLVPLRLPAQAPAQPPGAAPPSTARPAAPKPRPAGEKGAARGWTVPRTPDGKPDLQGLWTNATVTPLERPDGAKEFATAEELAALEKRGNRDEQAKADAERGTPAASTETPAAPARRNGIGDYNAIWWELGKKALENSRSSIIIGPSGKLPHTPETVQRLAANREYERLHPADGPEFRDNIERCLAWITSGPPMLPTFYNNTYKIYQTPKTVAILVEMIHDVRLIHLDGSAHSSPAVRQWMGDSRGHWEGDTLVVETVNINSKRGYIGGGGGRSGIAPNNDKMKVTERFTRTAADTIMYQFTVENPGIYTGPWSGEIPMKATDEPLYEYACHEGNYAMHDILSGARADEAAAAKGKEKK